MRAHLLTRVVQGVKYFEFSYFDFDAVDENNKVLYCELPKVGCTNWKRTMLQLIQPKTFGKLAFDDIKGPHGHYGEEGYKYITENMPLAS